MSTLRETLESAWDDKSKDEGEEAAPVTQEADVEAPAVEAAPTEEAPKDEPAASVEETQPQGERQRGPDGKFLPKAEKTETPKPQKGATSATPAPKADAKTGTAPPAPAVATAVKPPAGWKPAEREAFAKAPPEVQAAVARREREIAMAMQEAAPHKQTAQRLEAMTAPYMGLVRSQGGDVFATMENLWQTYGALHMAPPAHKAQLVANLMQTFGVDPGMVAAHLQGQPVAQGAPQFDPNQLATQLRQAGFLTHEDIKQQQHEALTNHHLARLEKFIATHEFYEDLRPTMEKLIAGRLADDFEDAYDKAAAMHPEVSAAMRQREEAKQANAARASTQRARAASTSLKSTPVGAVSGGQPRGLREILESHYDGLAGRQR